ncbi:MAG TPA: TonB-dependent receptor, partial [Chitinophagaceae bacterium]|nr:TonB-dependent receptor [Chitinophagaceae bacterium]
MRYLIFILFLVLHSSITSSQELKTDTIKEVSIVEKKVIQYATSSQVIDPKITQYYQHSSLQNLLQMHSNVFVKNYGVGNLSTISIRGSSAAQTQVLWNGVNINNALTGMSDFSSIPISFFDNIRIDYGGQDKNLALGGAVHLLNEIPRFYSTNKYNVSFGYESLQNAGLVLGANLSRKRFYQRLKININQSRNRYSFFNPDKKVESELEHADSKQINILSDSYFRLSSHANVSLHLWGQFQNREISPASFEDTSAKEEKISSFRSIIKFEKQKFNFYGLASSLGFFYEDYKYADSIINLTTKSDVITIPFQFNLNYKFGRRHHIYIQALAQNSFIASSSALSLHKAGLIASYHLDPIVKRLSIRANLQKEVTNVFSVPMIGSLITYLDMFKGGRTYLSLSTNYRMPTLNELYYSPGGNINLKPETSKNIEGGFNLSRNKIKAKWHLDMAMYNRQVKNWIV